jgi:hypothetical protein
MYNKYLSLHLEEFLEDIEVSLPIYTNSGINGEYVLTLPNGSIKKKSFYIAKASKLPRVKESIIKMIYSNLEEELRLDSRIGEIKRITIFLCSSEYIWILK